MTEREQPKQFDQAAVAQALKAESSKLADPAYGEGWHFQLNGTRTPLSLDTFPEGGVSRITTKGARIELFGGGLPTVEDEGVVFLRKDEEREHSTLTLHPDGGVSLGYMLDAGPTKVEGLPDTKDTEQMITEVEAAEKAIAEPAEPVVTVAKPPEKPETLNRMPGAFPDTRPMIQRVGTAEPETPRVTPAAAQEDESAPPKTEAAEDERQRVQLVGRLGRTPTIRETASKKLVAKFPLAVHLENGETAWHDVLTFGERAAGLKKRIEAGELVKGQEVEVVGYLHEREYKGRDGTPKTAQEIYSVAIKRR